MKKSGMFENFINGKHKKQSTLSFSAGCVFTAMMIVAFALIPLLSVPEFTARGSGSALFLPPQVPQGKKPSVKLVPTLEKNTPKTPVQPRDPSRFYAPIEIPKEIVNVNDIENSGPTIIIGMPGGDFPGAGVPCFGCLPGISISDFDSSRTAPPPPPKPTPSPPPIIEQPRAPIRIGGAVQQGKIISQKQPVYPPLAKAARVEGIVDIEAVVGKDGMVKPESIRIIRGHILLNQSAVDAILTWQYRPTTLNGEVMEIITTISVNFRFSN